VTFHTRLLFIVTDQVNLHRTPYSRSTSTDY